VSFNVKRQLLLLSVAKTDKLPLLYSVILLRRIMIYKSAFQMLKGVITILTLITIAIGVHGLLHLGLESVYNYNPIKMFIL